MIHSKDAGKSRDARNVGNNRTLGGSTPTAVVTAATAETLSTAGAPGTSTAIRTTTAEVTPATAETITTAGPEESQRQQ